MSFPLRFLDPDLRERRSPQFNSEFDPRWQVSFYHGLFNGPYGQIGRPYTSRGNAAFALRGGVRAVTPYGPGMYCGSDGAQAVAANLSYAPSPTQGTFISLTRPSLASSSFVSNYLARLWQFSGGVWIVDAGTFSSASLYFGWYNNGTDTRVNVGAAGLWAANDLVQTGFSYSGRGTRAFINGKLVASSATAPSTFDTRTTGGGLSFEIGEDANPGGSSWLGTIFSCCILDRALSDGEWGEIATDPFSWMFEPSAISRVFLPPAIGGAGPKQYAVTVG
jgi:hypothetical protein